MTRRTFVEIAAAGLCLIAGSVLAATSQMQVLLRKVRGRLRNGTASSIVMPQHPAVLPPGGERVSVEMALNSRCTSDSDGDPETFHWGMFDSGATLSSEQVQRIVNLTEKCQLAGGVSRVAADGAVLTFSLDAVATGHARDVSMIQSGMQQQAVCLACAALGVAMVFDSVGPDGTQSSDQKFVTTRMRLGGMKPSYYGAFWNSSAPLKERAWVTGNLPDPARDGRTPLVETLSTVRIENKNGGNANARQLSQLLWAARGRTPHLYKSTPWGLTIPTWQGLQNISSVFVSGASRLFQYVNWKNGRPTHRLEAECGQPQFDHIRRVLPGSNCFLILATNESHARALWEVGYQVLNIALQASALNIAYHTVVLDEQERSAFSAIPMGTPAVMIGLQFADEQFLKHI